MPHDHDDEHEHDHDDEAHTDEHECGKCGQTFDSESDLKDHAKDADDMDV